MEASTPPPPGIRLDPARAHGAPTDAWTPSDGNPSGRVTDDGATEAARTGGDAGASGAGVDPIVITP